MPLMSHVSLYREFELFQYVAGHFLSKFGRSFVDNVVRSTVRPVPGSVLYCDLAFSAVEHTGIYLGKNEIAHLDGSGKIEVVSPKHFLGRLDGWNTAISIYVSCRGKTPVGCPRVADRARAMVGKRRNYNVILDNCHQFSSGCLSGNYENPHNFFWMVKYEAKKYLHADQWRVWETVNTEYVA